MRIKSGAKVNGMRTEILLAINIADKIWSHHNQELVITEVTGAKHGNGSLHYIGCAFDGHTRYFTDQEKELVAKDLRDALVNQYDVIVEKTHIHVEYQPKTD